MEWYRQERFACPRCGQRLAVERAQVRRREVVTCQDCNCDIRLVPRGEARAPGTVAPAGDDAMAVELPA